MNPKTWCTVFILAVCAANMGFFGYVSFSRIQNQRRVTAVESELTYTQTALSGNVMIYGTLRSYDPSSRMVVSDTQNLYGVGEDRTIHRLTLLPGAFVGEQEVVTNGTETTVSTKIPVDSAQLAQLPAGTRIKYLVFTSQNGPAISYLLFGNPL
jgi:small nuclear ribonucleoprotein (snRNP)-like protein